MNNPLLRPVVVTLLLLFSMLAFVGCEPSNAIAVDNRLGDPLVILVSHLDQREWQPVSKGGFAPPAIKHEVFFAGARAIFIKRFYIEAMTLEWKKVCAWNLSFDELVRDMDKKLVIDESCPLDPVPDGLER